MKKNKKIIVKKKPIAPNNKTVIVGIIAIILVVGLFVLAYYFGFGQTGKAYTIGNVPLLAPLDLTKDPDLTLTALPEEGKFFSFNISLNIDSKNLVIGNYTLKIEWLEEDIYQVTIFDSIKTTSLIFGIDVLEEGDKSDFYINTNDNETDLKVSLANGKLILKNPHYISPGKTKVTLTDLMGTIYPLVVNLEENKEVIFRVNATSVLTPNLKIFIDGVEINHSINYTDNQTVIVDFKWTSPTGSKAVILKIVSDVKGLITTANYLLTVGDAAYLLDEEGFPKLSLNFINKSEMKANLTIEFDPVTDLQPLAFPCILSNPTIGSVFGPEVKKIYSYKNDPKGALVEVWTPGIDVPNDLNSFVDITKGYFLELAEAKPYSVTTKCIIPILATAYQELPPNPTSPIKTSITLNTGWNLISLPGILPIALEDIQEWPGLKLFECTIGYTCTEIKEDKILYPGKPYWIYAPEKQKLNFYLQK